MCDILKQIWSRPRGEWTRIVREELLPAIADLVVEELLRTLPAFSEAVERIGRDEAEMAVEHALLLSLGYRDTTPHERKPKPVPVVTPMPIARARQALFAALTGDRPVSDIGLAELSREAGWPLPDRIRAVVLASPNEAPQLAAALGHCLLSAIGGDICLLIPEPGPQARPALEALLRGRAAVVGHAVPLGESASSLRWARRLLGLVPVRGGPSTPSGPPQERAVFVDDHLSDMLLLQDESLARALAARWLRPLEELTPRQSERLEATLLVWLESGGAPEAARALKVHPQTVRYRLRQIEKLFGPALREPRTRFELELALRCRRLLTQARGLRPRARARARALGAAAAVRPLGMAKEARVNGL